MLADESLLKMDRHYVDAGPCRMNPTPGAECRAGAGSCLLHGVVWDCKGYANGSRAAEAFACKQRHAVMRGTRSITAGTVRVRAWCQSSFSPPATNNYRFAVTNH